jgi:4'-phosphopantetheinyl transferase EntD
VSRLFPPGVAAAELREAGDPRLLLPAEAAHLGPVILKRAQEFAAGRLCARQALAEFGEAAFPLEVGVDRQPVWPDLLLGSITHTAGYCAAAVAERRCVAALGLDSEVIGDVRAEIWLKICVPLETAWIESLSESERPAAVTLIFSAKEAFYKCQFPLVGERLNFHDVRIEAPAWGAAEGVFRAHALRRIALLRHAALPLQGRYRFHETFVTAGIGLAADEQSPQ